MEKELEPVILATNSYKSQLIVCRENLLHLTLEEQSPDFEINMDKLLSYAKTAEHTAEDYHMALSRSEFFNSPKLKRLLSEGLPKVKFIMEKLTDKRTPDNRR